MKYIRTLIPFTNEGFVTQAKRLPSNRYNPYLRPGGLEDVPRGLGSFACDHLGNPQTIPGGGSPPCRVQAPFAGGGRFPRLTRARSS